MNAEQSSQRRWRRPDPILALLGIFTLLSLAPLFAPGYFYAAHDGRHSVFYLNMFDATIRDGALLPRWAMHHIQGYGYPTFIIQSPLGFYVAEIFVLLGAGYTLAAKLTWATGFLGSAWGMYRLTVHWLRSGCAGYEQTRRQPRANTGLPPWSPGCSTSTSPITWSTSTCALRSTTRCCWPGFRGSFWPSTG